MTEQKEAVKEQRIGPHGGEGGNSFELRKSGQMVKSLRCYWEDSHEYLRGIEVTLTDKTTELFGERVSERTAGLDFGPDENITKTTIYKGYWYGPKKRKVERVGGLDLDTSRGAHLKSGTYKRGSYATYETQGKLAGVFGRCGADIDQLGLILNYPVISYKVRDVQYDLSNLKPETLQPVVACEAPLVNRGEREEHVVFSMSKTFEEQHSFTFSWELKIVVSCEFSAGVPFFAEGKWTVSAETTFNWTWGHTVTDAVGFDFQVDTTVAPRSKRTVKAMLLEGNISVPWEGTAELTYSDGTVDVVPDEGIYYGVRAFQPSVEYGPDEPLSEEEMKLAAGTYVERVEARMRHTLVI